MQRLIRGPAMAGMLARPGGRKQKKKGGRVTPSLKDAGSLN